MQARLPSSRSEAVSGKTPNAAFRNKERRMEARWRNPSPRWLSRFARSDLTSDHRLASSGRAIVEPGPSTQPAFDAIAASCAFDVVNSGPGNFPAFRRLAARI